jgi:hypothetical protein
MIIKGSIYQNKQTRQPYEKEHLIFNFIIVSHDFLLPRFSSYQRGRPNKSPESTDWKNSDGVGYRHLQ